MPDYIKISELPAGSAAALTDQFETNQSGTSRRLTLAQMMALVPSANSFFVRRGSNLALGAMATVVSSASVGAAGEVWAVWGSVPIIDIAADGYFTGRIYCESVDISNSHTIRSGTGYNQNISLFGLRTLTAAATFKLQASANVTANASSEATIMGFRIL